MALPADGAAMALRGVAGGGPLPDVASGEGTPEAAPGADPVAAIGAGVAAVVV
jgi:hypothetical protein